MLAVPLRLSGNPAFAPLLALCESVLYTSAELAKHWRYTEQHVHAMRRLESGPAFFKMPTNGGVRYRLSEIMAWEIHGHGGPLTPERLSLAVYTLPCTLEQRQVIDAHLRGALFPASGVAPTVVAEAFQPVVLMPAGSTAARRRGRPPK